jgi:hypothetical protein
MWENHGGTRRETSTLTRLEARIDLVDNIDPALAADQLVGAMTLHQTLERVADFHNTPKKLEKFLRCS